MNEKFITDIISNLRYLNNLEQVERLRKHLAEYTNDKLHFNEYNFWSLLNAKTFLDKKIDKENKLRTNNLTDIKNSVLLVNSEEIKNQIISLNDTDPDFIGDILKVIK